jgi:hypothetical protein
MVGILDENRKKVKKMALGRGGGAFFWVGGTLFWGWTRMNADEFGMERRWSGKFRVVEVV